MKSMTTLHYTAKVRDGRLLELPEEAQQLHLTPGEEIQIQLERADIAEPNRTPNEKMLDFLRIIEERHKDRPFTDGSDTQRLIDEARGGAMYGTDPVE